MTEVSQTGRHMDRVFWRQWNLTVELRDAAMDECRRDTVEPGPERRGVCF